MDIKKLGSVGAFVVLAVIVSVTEVSSKEMTYATEFLQILEEIHELIGSLDFKLIAEAARQYLNLYPYSSYTKPHVSDKMALGRQLYYYHQKHPINCFKQRAKFEKLYNELVRQPCERVVNLGKKHEYWIQAHPGTDNWDHKGAVLPEEWFKAVEICKNESSEATYKAFRTWKRS